MSCKDCVNRRDFLAKTVLAAALVVVDGCGDGQIGPKAATLGSGGVTVKLSDFPQLANFGTPVAISSDRALVQTSATTFLGLSRICTHQGCIIDIDTQNKDFVCPCHGSTFSNDGSVIRGPNIESPPIAPLDKLETTFDAAAGTVTVA